MDDHHVRAPVEPRFLELGLYDVDHLSQDLCIREPRAVSFAEMKINLVELGQTEL